MPLKAWVRDLQKERHPQPNLNQGNGGRRSVSPLVMAEAIACKQPYSPILDQGILDLLSYLASWRKLLVHKGLTTQLFCEFCLAVCFGGLSGV